MAMVWARGNLYIGGRFTAVGGVAARNVARWDGRRWHSLGSGSDNGISEPYRYDYYNGRKHEHESIVRALAVAPNGDVYVGGEFSRAGQVAATCLARWDGRRWNPVGNFLHLEEAISFQLDEQAERRWDTYQRRIYTRTFQKPYVSESPRHRVVFALTLASDGTLYAGGTFQYAATAYPADTTASSVARWDGRTWTVPGHGVPGTVHALAAAADGRVYAGGDLWSGQRANPDVRGRVACWDGRAWVTIGTAHNYLGTEMGSGIPGVVHALAVLPDGTLCAAGRGESYESVPGDTASTVARWDGRAWHYFGPGGLYPYSAIYVLASTADGRLYAAGQLEDSMGAHPRLLRWDGHRWQRLGLAAPAPAINTVQALAVTPAGKVFAGGHFQDSSAHPVIHYLARWARRRWNYQW
ncbi:ligand-binding sensor domain-containing protein [Hymenobacter yonginensis]|uniref:Galactose oxidase n=1 Tax=Hymenobacter yonginensis TaxID=748197 RepID=A0ABY7PUX8_9BACT|nr:hypothetical protein [Hymenobacter yonginensis]WBO86713.1 hypothetical protein O9Z63_20750 [Hymenobacter yonginensis]